MSDKPATPPPTPGQVQLQIELDPAIANGVFVNMAMVNHTDAEFTLDLIHVQPQAPKATVRARAIMTPRHMKRLVRALQENLSRYEARFGAIEVSETPSFPPTGGATA